jgi:N-hydroxyarylamine O-acetyltransferase
MKEFIAELEQSGIQRGVFSPEQAAIVMRKLATCFPFENLDVLNQIERKITPESIIEKILKYRRGGLCYELNSLLYLVLKELGFNASIGIGTVNKEGTWGTDRTHAIVLLSLSGRKYIADGGFGNRLALQPLELDGNSITSPAGSFRLRNRNTEKGAVALEIQNQSGAWDIHYAFDWNPEPWSELERIKQDILHHPHSAFNKRPLITNIFKDGTQSINDERLYRKWVDGREEEIVFKTKEDFLKTIRTFYPASITNEAEKFLK